MRKTLLLAVALLQPALLGAQEPPSRIRVYASVGLGFINLESRGIGIDIPLGFVLLMDRYRLIGAAHLVDLALMQEEDRDPRFVRAVNSFGEPVCFDAQTGFRVADFRCAGATDALLSLGADLSYVPVETSFFGGKPGKLALGVGYRLQNPRTAYGALSMFFDAPGGGGGGFRVALGRRYVFFGINWALSPRRLIGRH